MKKTKAQNFIEGAIILVIARAFVKVIGAVFKIPLYNILGGQGMAYFSVAYEIYTYMYILTTAGLPVAIARLVSESNAHGRYKNSRKILKVATSAFMTIGILSTVVVYFGADFIAELVSNENSALAIRVIAPALMFEIIMSSYRGYYQGCKDMIPTGISEVIVAAMKLVVGLAASTYVLNLGLPAEQALPMAAAGAILGATLGTVFGSLYLVANKFFGKGRELGGLPENPSTDRYTVILKKMLSVTIPIAIGSAALSLTNFVDTAMLIRRLQNAGMGQVQAETLYGIYSGMVRTMFNMPSAFITPIGMTAIPIIAEKLALNRKQEATTLLGSVMRIGMLLSAPASFGFFFMAGPILELLYSSRMDEVVIATPLLATIGLSVAPLCLVSITNYILQASGRERVPVFSLVAGGAVKVISNYILVGNPEINISGAPYGTFFCYFTTLLINIIALKSVVELPKLSNVFIKPIVAGVVSCGAARLFYNAIYSMLGNTISCVLAIGLAAVLYFIFAFMVRAVEKDEVLMLPKGDKIYAALNKVGWR